VEFVEGLKKRGKRVPGIGHRIKSKDNRDKRVELLQNYARKVGAVHGGWGGQEGRGGGAGGMWTDTTDVGVVLEGCGRGCDGCVGGSERGTPLRLLSLLSLL
jgi:hypothetical protein